MLMSNGLEYKAASDDVEIFRDEYEVFAVYSQKFKLLRIVDGDSGLLIDNRVKVVSIDDAEKLLSSMAFAPYSVTDPDPAA